VAINKGVLGVVPHDNDAAAAGNMKRMSSAMVGDVAVVTEEGERVIVIDGRTWVVKDDLLLLL